MQADILADGGGDVWFEVWQTLGDKRVQLLHKTHIWILAFAILKMLNMYIITETSQWFLACASEIQNWYWAFCRINFQVS